MTFQPMRPMERVTADRLNRLAKSAAGIYPGPGVSIRGEIGSQTISSPRDVGIDQRPLLAVNISDSASDYLPPYAPCAVVGIANSTQRGVINPIIEVRVPTADDISTGAPMAIVGGTGLSYSGGSANPTVGEVHVGGAARIIVRRNAGDSGSRLSLVEDQKYAGIGLTGDWIIVGEEGDPAPDEDDTHLALALYNPLSEPAYDIFTMGAGNSLGTFNGTEYFGLVGSASVSITEVPTAVPSAIDAVYSDGLSAATGPDGLVWMATRHNNGTSFEFDKIITVPEDVQVISFQSAQVPITGGGGATAKVYFPGLV